MGVLLAKNRRTYTAICLLSGKEAGKEMVGGLEMKIWDRGPCYVTVYLCTKLKELCHSTNNIAEPMSWRTAFYTSPFFFQCSLSGSDLFM
jgi:hypothetical protein